MFAPFTRSMTLTFGLFGAVASPDLMAETDPEHSPIRAYELGATSITAEGLGTTTEHTGGLHDRIDEHRHQAEPVHQGNPAIHFGDQPPADG